MATVHESEHTAVLYTKHPCYLSFVNTIHNVSKSYNQLHFTPNILNRPGSENISQHHLNSEQNVDGK
jgi:hypothetical protein